MRVRDPIIAVISSLLFGGTALGEESRVNYTYDAAGNVTSINEFFSGQQSIVTSVSRDRLHSNEDVFITIRGENLSVTGVQFFSSSEDFDADANVVLVSATPTELNILVQLPFYPFEVGQTSDQLTIVFSTVFGSFNVSLPIEFPRAFIRTDPHPIVIRPGETLDVNVFSERFRIVYPDETYSFSVADDEVAEIVGEPVRVDSELGFSSDTFLTRIRALGDGGVSELVLTREFDGSEVSFPIFVEPDTSVPEQYIIQLPAVGVGVFEDSQNAN